VKKNSVSRTFYILKIARDDAGSAHQGAGEAHDGVRQRGPQHRLRGLHVGH